jgi:carotene biosynthesis associated membrane protein
MTARTLSTVATPSAVSTASARFGVRVPWSRVAVAQRLPLSLAALTVLSQIGYPLTSGAVRDRLTVATVLLWCAASLSHAVLARGWRFAAGLVLFSAGLGFATEVVGTSTGWPFGSYAYTSTLGPRLAGVPLIIPLAWAMMAYPALLVGRRIGSPVLAGALALASWDLFLDPQMVQAGHWHFTGGGPSVNGIPLSNTAGWIVVSFVIMLLLSRLPERSLPGSDDVPLGLYLWTYASSVLAAAVFFHRPGVALVGGLVMGVPVALLLMRLRLRMPAAPR